jgi:hypothetical protein
MASKGMGIFGVVHDSDSTNKLFHLLDVLFHNRHIFLLEWNMYACGRGIWYSRCIWGVSVVKKMARQYIETEKYNWGEIITGIIIIIFSVCLGYVTAIQQPCKVPILVSMIFGVVYLALFICGFMFIVESKEIIRKYVKTEGK